MPGLRWEADSERGSGEWLTAKKTTQLLLRGAYSLKWAHCATCAAKVLG